MRFRFRAQVKIKTAKVRLLFYFTMVDAISTHHEKTTEKLQYAIRIVFYRGKCDRDKSKDQISSPERKCVKTLAPVHQSDVSLLEATHARNENSQNS